MARPSVCIVGAGAIGLCCAVQLLRRGIEQLTVIERAHPAEGSSGLSVGVIETQYLEPLEIELRVRAMRFFSELERELQLEVRRIGYLRLGRDAHAAQRFAASVECQRELGVADARLIDRGEIARLIPDLSLDGVEYGLWGPSDGFIDGHLYCTALAEIATARGARILVRQPLTGAERTGDGRHVLRTAASRIEADYVVNAAGAWAPQVARLLGTEMAIIPQRHEAVVIHLPAALDYVMPMVMDYTPHSGDDGLYFRHERGGALIAGLHSEEETARPADPERYARSASPEFLEDVAKKFSMLLPSLADASLAHGWAGLYPLSPDGAPQVGPSSDDPSVILAGGAGGSGIQLSPVIGELAAEWIVRGGPDPLGLGALLDPRRASLMR